MKKSLLLLTLLFFAMVASITAQVVNVSGDITTNTTWTKNNTYLLNGFVYVKNGANLTIEPGTVIKGDKASRASLIITRGSKITADGTFNEPIVFTSNEAIPAAGDWGGLIILGRASTNGSFNGTTGLQAIEGDINNANGDGLFGNGDLAGPATQYDNDNSGILRYVRIEYPGVVITPGNEINGLTLGGVGRGTTMDYVQVSFSNDDSFEWFGGNVNAKHLIAYRGLDDDFDTDNGFSGTIQFAFSQRDPAVSDAAGASNSFESDNDANATTATPKTAANFVNVTVVGPSTVDAAQFFSRGALLRRNTEQALFNCLIVGAWPNAGLRIDGTNTGANATAGTLEVKNLVIAGAATPVNTNAAGFDVNAWFATAGWGNQSFPASGDAKLTDPFNLNAPNLVPQAGSPVLTAGSFTSSARIQSNPYVIKVAYAGAFGDNDWTCGWARFAGGSTTCGATVVSGNITTNTTWTKDKTYVLNGFVYVKNCATLTIEPGTVIKGDKATRGTLIVTRCAKIVADGTFNEPIVFTSAAATPAAGDWGGLVILGRATTNGSFNGTAGLQAIEGDLNNASGDGLFGNGDLAGPATQYDNDNSGILRYVRIEYPGIVITPGNEINGLTLGGVGRGTTMDYVQVSYSNDDSYEWFGGNVNAKHLIAYRGLDDDFDTDNGFSGNIQFAFSVRDPQVSDAAGASNSFESDNDANATEAAPKTSATFSNVTVVGPSTVDATQFFSRGALLRRNTNQALFNTLIVGAWPNAGLRIDGTNTGANATAGTLEAKNIIIAGPATAVNTNAAGFDVNAWFGTAGWGNQSFPASADAKLTDPFNLSTPNLLPLAGSPVLNASNFAATRVNNANFIKVPYVGAFGDNDWTCGWARFAGGATTCAATVVSGNITTNTTWTKDKEYVLNGFVYVKNCATLTIEPGTVIKGDKATRGTLIVTRCAKIVADGTRNQPIVFTSAAASPAAGDWGGLVILGRATTNGSFNGVTGLQAIEGDLNNAAGDGLFGNGDLAGPATQYDNDNSGILRYVRIEYPGIVITPGNEINGLTLGGVGRGTTLDYVQVSFSNDDSYEWFGGNVNAKHLIAYRGLDDDFDTDNGFSGNVQFAFSLRDPQVSDAAGASNSFESDNDANATEAAPKTAATFSNVTVVGPATVDATQFYSRGALLRRNTNQALFNTLIVGAWPNAGLRIDGTNTGANATAGTLEAKNIIIAGSTTPVNTNAAGFDVNAWFGTAGWGNQSFPTSAAANLTDPFNLNTPNLVPQAGSPVWTAASFAATRVNNPSFIKVPYVGAFGDVDWTCGWARFSGGVGPCAPEVVSGDITTNTTWTNAKEYTLNGFVYVKNCATLTIEPGTVIKGDKATRGTLIVSRCSKIIADGTADAPIVFTSSSATPTAGDWGGLIILGRASTNGSFNGTVGLQAVEGDINNANGDGLFGNGDLAGPATQYDNDNSGILRYVRIEYPGIVITPGNEINGLTLGGVGRGTTMDYVQVSYSNDDSYEWFGGNVNAKHLIAYRGLDDDFDTDNGFSGNLQFLLAVRDPQVSDAAGASNGFESDNDANATNALPKTAATITNATMIAPATVDAAQFFSRGALLRRNTEQSLFNTLFVGAWPNAGIRIDGNNTGANATANLLEVKNVSIAGAGTAVNTNAAGFVVNDWFNTSGWGNTYNAASGSAELTNPFNVDLPNAMPNLLSPVLTNGSFVSSPRLNNAFFTTVNYIGAFGRVNGSINDWTCKWADFKGGAADCVTSTDDFNKVVNTLKLFPTVTGDYTNLEIDLKENVNLNVTIYSMNGTNFGTLLDENVAAGNQVIGLNVSNLTAGFYFVQIQAGNAIKTEKLIIVR